MPPKINQGRTARVFEISPGFQANKHAEVTLKEDRKRGMTMRMGGQDPILVEKSQSVSFLEEYYACRYQ
jgi:hypothetical protein